MADQEVENSQSLHGTRHQIYIQLSSALKGNRRWASATVVLLFILITAAAFISWIDLSDMIGLPSAKKIPKRPLTPKRPKNSTVEYPLNCSNKTITHNCTSNYPQTFEQAQESQTESCPEYFRWIYEDLKPWKASGISRDTLERAKQFANFRLAIVDGIPYVEKYHGAFQTRDLFTIWSFVQLFRMYPGKLPDLELMFRLGDIPIIHKRDFQGSNAMKPPPVLFQYCGHDETVGIIFPDWSYWGWVETNIKPWKLILESIMEGSNKTKWENRIPYAFWKGNQYTSGNRVELMKCNASPRQEWNARLYQQGYAEIYKLFGDINYVYNLAALIIHVQDWVKESHQGFANSKLEDQCTHRYKIYVEGRAWSVSDKYILACDSMTLIIKPEYSDFFLRSLVPLQHYWPISPKNLCKNIKFAVEWGNKNPAKAKAMGKAGSDFMRENLKMEYVYSYMFHSLIEYAKLLRFKPTIPPRAVRLCAESVACFENDLRKKFLVESMVTSPSDTLPCTIPPPYNPPDLKSLFKRKDKITKKVEKWAEKG